MSGPRHLKVAVLFGTRPEIIKLAPVIKELDRRSIDTTVISAGQHRHLLKPFLKILDITADHDLNLMRPNQTLNDTCSRAIGKISTLLQKVCPDVVLVQGDTTTAFAGALAAFNLGIRVGHIEAGLRSGNRNSPFPEEMNRRLISQVADLHFAATKSNRDALIAEGIDLKSVSLTGNPVVDSLNGLANSIAPSSNLAKLLQQTEGMKRILLTTHRRESFGDAMSSNLSVLRRFVEAHDDTCLFFPVHPNPKVRSVTSELLSGSDRVFLLEPMGYNDFIAVMKAAWLIVSDSGGVQEEAPSLGKPLLVIRENTERPEAIAAGVAILVGNSAKNLEKLLESNYSDDSWIRSIRKVKNPFGDGKASKRIVDFILKNVKAA